MRGRAMRRTGGLPSFPVGRFAPLLIVSVVVLIVCLNTRFSVARAHQENRDLKDRLQDLRESVERAEVDVARLAGRDRIETVAARDFGLRNPGPGDQTFLPEWEETRTPKPLWGALAAAVRSGAGRGLGILGGLLGEEENEGDRSGGGR